MLDFKLSKLWLGAFCMTIRGRLTVDQSSVYRIILHSNEKKILWMRLEEEPQWQSLRDYEYWLRCEMLFMLHLHDLQDYILKIKCDKCFYEPILLLDFFSGSLWAYLTTTTTTTTTTFACYLEKNVPKKKCDVGPCMIAGRNRRITQEAQEPWRSVWWLARCHQTELGLYA